MAKFTFRGLMPPVLTPFKKDFSLNLDVIPKYVALLKKLEIKGILVNGTSGEGMSMTVAERKTSGETWIKEGHAADMHVMIQVGGAPMPDVIELTKHAEKIGADSILVLPELFFKPTNVDDLVDYLEQIGNAAPNTPLLYYHNPGYSSVNINMPSLVLAASKKIKTFRGLKFTSVDLQEGDAVLKACGSDNVVFLGADQLLVAATAMGFDSSIGTTFNMLPQYGKAILEGRQQDGHVSNQIELAQKQRELNDIIEVVVKNGTWVPAMKVAMELLMDIPVGPPRPPLRPLTEIFVKQMEQDLKAMGLEIHNTKK